jgi:hypothetical protein
MGVILAQMVEAHNARLIRDTVPLLRHRIRMEHVPESDLVRRVLSTLLNELLDGARSEVGWMLNPEDPGFLASLDRLSAQQASAIPTGGGASVAAHVDHLRYGLTILNRWSAGEDLFAAADYSASWRRLVVSDAEWASRRADLRREAYAWREAIQRWREPSEVDLTGIAVSIAHLAYHLGAIRQIDRSTRGPAARDQDRLVPEPAPCDN